MYRIINILFITILLQINSFAKETFSKDEKKWIKNNTVTIAMLNNFEPFSYEEDNIHKGFTLDLLNKISKNSGLKFNIQTSNWSIALKNFKEKKVDMICGISYMKRRESFTLFTKPYYEIPTFIFGLENDIKYENNSSLVGKTIAVSKDMFYIKKLKDLGINVLEVNSSFEKAKAVITGKADYFLASYTTGIKSINEQSLINLKVIDEFYDIKKEDLRFGINKDKPILHSILSKTLSNISTQEMKELSNKWMIFNNNSPNDKIILTKEEKSFIQNHNVVKYSAKDWEPIFTVENKIVKGMVKDYLEIIEKRTGLKFEYINTTSVESLHKKFLTGVIDMIPAIQFSHKDRNRYSSSNVYIKYPMMIITDNRYKYIENLSQLNQKKVVMLNIPPAKKYIEKNYKTIELTIVSDISEALLLVENQEVDAFVGHIAPSVFFLNQMDQSKLKISGTTNFEYKHIFQIKQNKPILLSIINKAIDSISPVEKNQIYSKWVQSNSTEKIVDYSLVYKVGLFFLLVLAFISYRHYELQKINKKLKDSKNQIENILNSTLEGIVITKGLKVINANKEALKLLNYKNKEDFIGKELFAMVADEALHLVKARINSGNTKPYEVNLKRSDGTTFPALARGTNIHMESANMRISSIIDITDMKNQEKLFLQQSKMAALGEMIGNIAHQWRQPLSIITTSASGLKLKKDYGILEDKDINSITDAILEGANFLSKTIDDFDNYLKGEKNLEQVCLDEVLNSILNIMKDDIKDNNIKLIYNTYPNLKVKAYKSELIQALLNILYNSKDALLKIDTNRMIQIILTKEKDFINISIQDNAGGISKEIINKIYEPYFTTKHQSQGTGLGLYMAYNIIKEINGNIEVSNSKIEYERKDYLGAKFSINLPRS